MGKTQEELAAACGTSRKTIGNIERDVHAPGAEILSVLARLGADIQYILTGVRSANLDKVAEEAGTYNKEPQGGRGLSREEEVLIEKYRRLKPSDRTRAQAVVDAFASAAMKTRKKTGND